MTTIDDQAMSVEPRAQPPVHRALAGYLPIAEHGVVGDLHTAALVGTDGSSASMFVSASEDAVKAGAHAGNLVKTAAQLVGGKGGGAPAQAQGGGKDPAGAEAALAAMPELLANQLS